MQGMEFEELKENWDKFGKTDPLWSIVSEDDRKGNKWEIEEFFATGEKEIERLLTYLASQNIELPKGQALDFGCGIGRVTQPMSRHFEVCHGVDIAPTMIELANHYNQQGDKCQFHLNEREDLKLFADGSMNFIYCVITFQNMAPRYTKKYIGEFLRLIAPNGLILFQVPSRPLNLRLKIKQRVPQFLLKQFYRLKYRQAPVMELHGIPKEEIVSLVTHHGGTILHIKEDRRAFEGWSSFQYLVTNGL